MVSLTIMAIILACFGGFMTVILYHWQCELLHYEEASWLADYQSQLLPPPPFLSVAILSDIVWRDKVNLILLIGGSLILSYHFVREGIELATLCVGAILVILLALAAIDWRTHLLPDRLTQPGIWLGLLCATLLPWQDWNAGQAIIGAVIGFGTLWVPLIFCNLLKKIESIGYGDLKLMALIGAWVGPFAVLIVLAGGAIMACLWQGVMLIMRKSYAGEAFAFGPWLASFSIGYLLFGADNLVS